MTIRAVFENGVFRPKEKVDFPDRCDVEIEVPRISAEGKKPSLDEVYALLSQRFDSCERDVAARHDEHQP